MTDTESEDFAAFLEAYEKHVREVLKPGWMQTYPVEGFYSVALTSGQDVTGKDFGNYADTTVEVQLVPVGTPSPDDATTPPPPITQVAVGTTYYLEVWVQDTSAGKGVQGGSVNIHYDTALVDATEIIHKDYTVLPTGEIKDPEGLVDDVGGATFDRRAVAPDWARLVYVEFHCAGSGAVEYSLTPGQFSFALSELGNVDWGQVDLTDTAQVDQVTPGVVDVRLVDTPTPTDANGEVDALPDGEEWLDEWDRYWVEIWLSTPNTTAYDITGANVSLSYTTTLTSAKHVEFPPIWTPGPAPIIDDVTGQVAGIQATTSVADVGDDRFVLLARVLFEPTANDQAPVDEVNHVIGPYGLAVGPEAGAVDLSGIGTVPAQLGPEAAAEVWAVVYDIDDNDQVDFGDFSFFAGAFGLPADGAEPPMRWWADFDKADSAKKLK
jgi:hypothetical protein